MTDEPRDYNEHQCSYGASRRRVIGIVENGRIVKFTCPRCGEEWNRDAQAAD